MSVQNVVCLTIKNVVPFNTHKHIREISSKGLIIWSEYKKSSKHQKLNRNFQTELVIVASYIHFLCTSTYINSSRHHQVFILVQYMMRRKWNFIYPKIFFSIPLLYAQLFETDEHMNKYYNKHSFGCDAGRKDNAKLMMMLMIMCIPQ